MGAGPTPAEFRATMGRFATGVTVVTTVADGVPHGMTANAFCSVSLDPMLVLVCVDRRASMWSFLERADTFAVSVLAADQEHLSVWFASPDRPSGAPQFAEVAWRPAAVSGSPLLEGSVATVDCRIAAVHDGGDHAIVVGEVLALDSDPTRSPLVWFGGAYHAMAESDAVAPPD